MSVRLALGAVAALLLVVQCVGREDVDRDVEVWGCERWPAHDTCEILGNRSLTVVTPGLPATVSLSGSALQSEVRSRIVEGTRVVTATVGADGELVIRTPRGALHVMVDAVDAGSARARLKHLLDAKPAKNDAARELAEQIRTTGSDVDQAYAVSALARVAIRKAVRREDAEHAHALFSEAIVLFQRLGLRDDAARDLVTRAWVEESALRQPDIADGTRAIAGGIVEHSPELKATLEFYGLTASKARGDLRGALAQSARLDERIRWGGAVDLQGYVLSQNVDILIRLGRFDEARSLVDQMVVSGDPCRIADAAGLYALMDWLDLQVDPAAPVGVAAALARIDSSLQSTCGDLQTRAFALANSALLALALGDSTRARAALDLSRSLGSLHRGALEPWWQDIEARLAFADGHADVTARIYGELAERTQQSGDLELEWHARVGQARVAAAVGDQPRARMAGARAHALSLQLLRRAPLGDGKQPYALLFKRASDEQLERLLAAGDVAGALQVARDIQAAPMRELSMSAVFANPPPEMALAVAAYRRTKAELDRLAAEDWQRPTDQMEGLLAGRQQLLREAERQFERMLATAGLDGRATCAPTPSRPGELLLVQHASGGSTRVFAVEGERATVHTVGAGGDLAALDAPLQRAERIRILEAPDPVWRLADKQWRGRRLGDQKPLAYGLDACSRPPRPRATQPRALLVENPRGNLDHAKEEAAAIDAFATSSIVIALRNARVEAVSQALVAPELDLFHYSGHAVHGGVDGWGSALLLAEGERLTVPDVLALGRVPAQVVLSACETGVRDGSGVRLLGLGQAFVVSGAEEVLVTTRAVQDEVAAELMTQLYQWLARGDDLPTALFHAANVLAPTADAGTDYLRDFQVLVP